ncbi:MAG TPA: apolipoprotein N-acyltransferase [Jatrophihabitantaceae bacterium]|nr:apolipoprotein N-acyltransferase [Jatrophihabitantaceae bacterium]
MSGAPFRTRWAALIAATGGVLGALAFPQVGWWPLAFVSVAALSVAVHGRRARTGAWLGYLYGAAFFVPLLHWTGVYVGAFPWLLLAAAEAGFMAALGAALTALQRLRAPAFWVASAWVLQEALRDRLPFGGFPWGRLAFSQADSPFRWFARLGGMPLLSFAVALTAAAVWQLGEVARGDGGLRRRAIGPFAAALAVTMFAVVLAGTARAEPSSHDKRLSIAVIQGSVPDRGLAFEDRAREVLDNHIAQTDKLAADIAAGRVERPDLVLWPENASDVDPFQDPVAFQDIDNAVKRIGVPVLVGAILQGPGDKRRNAGILWSPTTGPGAQYIKRHPVPFGEYIPLRSVAKVFSSDVNLVSQDMVGGHGNGLLRGGPVPIGDVICFEVAYDSLVQSSVRAGAQLVVVQTNNATFGHTSETYQQLAMTKLRAIETGRTVIQAATTGKSAIVEPDGKVVAESGALFTPSVLVSSIPLETDRTLAVRLGAVPEYVLAAIALAGILYAALPWMRSRRWHRPGRPATDDVEEMVRT